VPKKRLACIPANETATTLQAAHQQGRFRFVTVAGPLITKEYFLGKKYIKLQRRESGYKVWSFSLALLPFRKT
jgi:hypothetical protein